MSVRMKGRRIRRIIKTKPKKGIPWRHAARKDLERYSEGGQMLRGSRHKRDITQRELAEAILVSPHHISEMENGKRPIGKEMARRLATFFKTDYRVFL